MSENRHTVYKTKERFFPVTHVDDWQPKDNFPAGLVNGENDDAWITVYIPKNFKSLKEIMLVMIPAATLEPMFIQIQTDYGGIGELYNINSENSPGKPVNTVVDTKVELDLMDVVDTRAVKAGDYIGVKATYVSNTNAYVLGVRISYKAKSKD